MFFINNFQFFHFIKIRIKMNCPIKCPIDVVSLNRHYKNHKVLFYSFIILSGFINRFGKDFTVKILKLIPREKI